jgi:hypothetical protein
MDELLLGKAISQTFQKYGIDSWAAAQMTTLVRILVEHHAWCDPLSEASSLKSIAGMFHEEEVRLYLNVNRYDNVLWFNKERMEHLLYWLFTVSVADALTGARNRNEIVKMMEYRYGLVERLLKNAAESGWQVERFLASLTNPKSSAQGGTASGGQIPNPNVNV